jgi:tRNA(Ile)-lysidine synthase
MSVFVDEFEQKFENSISELSEVKTILLAVSGGSDSMAMLSSCINLIENPLYSEKYKNLKLKVVTINHRIRCEEESFGDCLFVKNFCDLHNIPCFIENAKDNEIENLSAQRGMGTEEAARFFRYDIFEKLAVQENADCIFLAHNKDDQLETLIQRFFQGSFAASSLGIPKKRSNFFRPMMDFSKKEILQYLSEKNIQFRTDKTNFENDYLRNKIRNLVIPCVENIFGGWESALLKGVQKKSVDEDFFDSECKKYSWNFSENQASMQKELFENLHKAIKIRLVYQCLTKIKANHRIPYEIIETFCDGNNISSGGVNFCYTKDKVLINNKKNSSTDSHFFAIIEESGKFPKEFFINNGFLCFSKEPFENTVEGEFVKKIKIPCCVELKNNDFVFEEIPCEYQETIFVKIKGFCDGECE